MNLKCDLLVSKFAFKWVNVYHYAAVWTSFTAVWSYGAVRSPSPVFALFSLPFWGVGAQMGRTTASTALETTRLAIVPGGSHGGERGSGGCGGGGGSGGSGGSGGGRFCLSWSALGRTLGKAEGPLEDISGAEVVTHAHVNGIPVTVGPTYKLNSFDP